jgi:hypothetical protein
VRSSSVVVVAATGVVVLVVVSSGSLLVAFTFSVVLGIVVSSGGSLVRGFAIERASILTIFGIAVVVLIVSSGSLVRSLSINRVIAVSGWISLRDNELLKIDGVAQDNLFHDRAQRANAIIGGLEFSVSVVHHCRGSDNFVFEINLELISVSLHNLCSKSLSNTDSC